MLGADPRRYNRPKVNEVAAVVINLSASTTDGREFLIYHNDGRLRSVRESHAAFLPLRFPLLIPFGRHGWHYYIPLGLESSRDLFSLDPVEQQAARMEAQGEFAALQISTYPSRVTMLTLHFPSHGRARPGRICQGV